MLPKVVYLTLFMVCIFFSPGAFAQEGSYAYSPGNAQAGAPTDPQAIYAWFGRYDQVRRKAQMSPQERQKADNLLTKGLSIFVPGPEKAAGQMLLSNLVRKYQIAVAELKQLPLYPETEQLHRGYFQYFSNAQGLFEDYLRVQDNMFAKDNQGRSIMSELMGRKQALEVLEGQCKELDGQLRARLRVKPYAF